MSTTPPTAWIMEEAKKRFPGWNWLRHIPSSVYYDLQLLGWLDWEMEGNEPASVSLLIDHTQKRIMESRTIATLWDEEAVGMFWYRDFTMDGLPFARRDIPYASIFVFQLRSDARRFREFLLAQQQQTALDQVRIDEWWKQR